jgi:hypothetical protein
MSLVRASPEALRVQPLILQPGLASVSSHNERVTHDPVVRPSRRWPAVVLAVTTSALAVFAAVVLANEFSQPANIMPIWVVVVGGICVVLTVIGGAAAGNTVLVTVIAATALELVAALAIADYGSNSQPLTGPYAVAVAPGIGLLVLPLGAAVALVASTVDVGIGLRRASHDAKLENGDTRSPTALPTV